MAELYGEMDPETRDWTDGVLSNHFRTLCKPLPPGRDEVRWIVFDGDVDAVWVENMNSVMDDNKLSPCQRRAHPARGPLQAPVRSRRPAVRVTRDHLPVRHGVRRPEEPRVRVVHLEVVQLPARGAGQGAAVLFDKYMKKCIDYCLEGVDGEVLEKPRF